MELIGTYNWLLVLVSVLAAMGSSFVALSTVPRIHASVSNNRSLAWVIAFGLSLGTGIWTMHFIAILALKLPVTVEFDLLLTIFSWLLAVIVSAVAIAPLRSGGSLNLFSPTTLFIGTMMGAGIAGMHYSGMAAMRLNATMSHSTAIVTIAIIIAIVASTAALLIANQLRDHHIFSQLGTKSVAAIIMGLAVSAMHYTAMEGMAFYATATAAHFESTVDPLVLAIFLIIIAFLIQGGIIISALFDEAYAISEEAAANMKRRADINQAISDILSVAMQKQPLPQMMLQVLEVILAIEWLSLQKMGSIFISKPNSKQLQMVAQCNLHPELLVQCKQIDFGHCLCGKAAQTGKLVHKICLDHDHTVTFEAIREHGHYCVPVLSQGEVLAVINLYLDHGHQQSDDEIVFLTTVADAIAPMIQNSILEEQALKIFAAIDQAGEAVVITDQNGTIEYINKAFTHITGYGEMEAIGKKPSILKSGNQDEAFYRNMWQTIKAGEIWQGEVTEKRKDGSFYPAMLTISPIRSSNHEITHYVGIHEDLSEHKNLEAQFRQAQKMEALGTLVGGIAHDFNNMLAGMIGNLFIIKGRVKEQPEIFEKVERVEKVGFQAAEMIKQMLVFARNDDVDLHQISLSTFIKEAFNLHQIAIPESIRLKRKITLDALPIRGNPAMLQQLLLNLMGNAVDALEGVEDPTIIFNLQAMESSSDFCQAHVKASSGSQYAHMRVADNGCGIQAKHMEHIFDPFFTTKEVGKGTGLGLSMSATIAESHGGFIEASSSAGEGTVFDIYLPMVAATDKACIPVANNMVYPGKGEVILVVDDDETLRKTTAETLQTLGYRTLTASNGREAVEIYQATKIHLVVMDVVMPEMSGPDAAKAILQINPDAHIVFVTGYDRESSLKVMRELEDIPFLDKPFEITELHRTIQHALKPE